MRFPLRRLPMAVVACGAAWAFEAAAISLSPSGAPAVLGQVLDFAVQVRLQPGETLAPECVSAEVSVGDRRVPPALVRALVVATGSDSARIRVLTDQPIDEPVVGVVLHAGCADARYSRRYVVLADPPLEPAGAVPPGPARGVPAAALPNALSMAEPAAAEPASAARAPAAPAQPLAVSGSASGGAPEPRPARDRVQGSARAAAPTRQPRDTARARQRAERAAAARTSAAARAAAPRAARAATPRLQLEAVEPAPAAAAGVEQALQAVAEAAQAARAAASAASAASARIAALERTVTELRAVAGKERAQADELRSRLARAEQAGRWTTPLLTLVLLLTGLAAWLAWRLNAADRARQQGWQLPGGPGGSVGPAGRVALGAAPSSLPAALDDRASEHSPSRQPTAPIPFVNSEIKLPAAAPGRARPAWPAPVTVPPDTLPPPPAVTRPLPRPEADPPMAQTEVLPPRGVFEEAAPRDVSIEELIDLEQQAEFFIVLGQDEAAIDLLVEHLRHTGGGSPLPYLKLLEIYRRSGQRAEYERMRDRFNQRFNAYAPPWEADLLAGRGLETYAGVIPRLQQVWPRPLDAMAELEALLFRKSRGELFDLPAYREVLFLYSLARDLLDREAAESGHVDLLLPMADGGEFSSTSPVPYLSVDTEAARRAGAPRRPSAVDFDLSAEAGEGGVRRTSLFGPLDEGPAPPSRR